MIYFNKNATVLELRLVQYGWDASRKIFFIGRDCGDLKLPAALTILAGAKTRKFKTQFRFRVYTVADKTKEVD